MNYKKTILLLASLVACSIFALPLTPAYAVSGIIAPGTVAAVQLNDDPVTTPPADTTTTTPPSDTTATATPADTTTTVSTADTGTTIPPVSDAAGTTPPPPPPPPTTSTTDSAATTSTTTTTTAPSNVVTTPPAGPTSSPLSAPPSAPSGDAGTFGHHRPFTPPSAVDPPPSDPSGTFGHHHRPNPNPNPNPHPYPYPYPSYQYPYTYYPYYNYYNSVFPYDYNYYLNNPIQPQPDYAPTISSFTASPNYVQPGQSATLSWIVSNANSVNISPYVGPVAISSSATVTPSTTTTYTITASNSVGTVTASTTVAVAPAMTTYPTYSSPPVDTSTIAPEVYTPVTPAGINLWLPIVLLIALMGVAAAVIIALVTRKPAASVQHSGTASALTAAAATAPAATLPATGTPHTTPIGAGAARLVTAGGGELPIRGGAMSLGRSDLRSLAAGPDKADLISRKHLTMDYENGDYYIEDANSTNGTRLNGESIRGKGKQLLRNGDTIEVADALKLTFRI
ncbi:MAG: FHA domain-containing protein [Dehalococcoidia bacterium]